MKLKSLFIKLDAVIRKEGLFVFSKLVITKFLKTISVFSVVAKLKKNNFEVRFINEGDVSIFIPPTTYFDVIRNFNFIQISNSFSKRINSEPLLRQVVHRLYTQGFVSQSLSVIDIGAWIGDNALVWAKLLEDKSIIFAIDPSKRNLDFIKEISKHNNLNNIKLVEAVCSDKDGNKMNFSGNIDHASFTTDSTGYDSGLSSRSLDSIVGNTAIGLIHLDVEGHEFEVMLGAQKIIERDRPIIIFEQHLIDDNSSKTIDWLERYEYKTTVVNEILTENRIDCRNFISFPKDFQLNEFIFSFETSEIDAVIPASFGPVLLRV